MPPDFFHVSTIPATVLTTVASTAGNGSATRVAGPAIVLLVIALTALAVLALILIGINRRRRAASDEQRRHRPDDDSDPWAMAGQRLQTGPSRAGDDDTDSAPWRDRS